MAAGVVVQGFRRFWYGNRRRFRRSPSIIICVAEPRRQIGGRRQEKQSTALAASTCRVVETGFRGWMLGMDEKVAADVEAPTRISEGCGDD